ncbi:MAG TPA: hypothetical protein DEA08_00335 [Planctomycetes bacterium]|nr:hypothetical protein [Planctomycetota bacterium]
MGRRAVPHSAPARELPTHEAWASGRGDPGGKQERRKAAAARQATAAPHRRRQRSESGYASRC